MKSSSSLIRSLLIAAIALFSGAASAKELTFKFDIYSSGPMIYACNAGLRHVPPTLSGGPSQVCHWAGRPATSANNCQAGQHNCVCTGVNGGAYLMDFLRYKSFRWVDGDINNGGWNRANAEVGAKTASNDWTYAQTIPTTGRYRNPLYTQLEEVTFDLGSELYGAEFFVDICFRGSQIDYFWDDSALNVSTSNSLLSRISVTDVDQLGTHPNDPIRPGPGGVDNTSTAYLNLSDLGAKAVTICDLQGVSPYRFAHNGGSAENGQYDTLDTSLNFDNEASNEYYYSSSWQTVTASSLNLIDGWINQSNYKHPRFCRVRYYFKERSFAERRWQRHDARVITKTIIEEAAVND